MRVSLVSMPWAAIHTPSLALGILTQRLRDTVPEAEVETRYVNLDCAEWIAATLPAAGRRDYDFFALESYFLGCGDWVFSSALYDDPQWRVPEFRQQLTPRLSDREREACLRLHAEAPGFIDEQARSIASTRPDLVCFTTTFQQNVASLALARRLKTLLPEVRCVLGGANCDAEQGEAIHRAFPFVDFVVRGEGERVFPALVRQLIDQADLAGVPGLCWRRRSDPAAHRANPMSDQLLAPAEIPMPDYDAYFARVATLSPPVRSWFEPQLVIESARGCWWGEKHHCTFCGLNGSAMTFRSKPPAVFTKELAQLAGRYRVLDFFAVDNILDMGYLETAVRDLADGPADYRIQYEIKSNLRLDQLQRLRDAGITTVQPGVESLSTAVLKLMDKGVTGTQNVRLLRDAESLGLSVIWNYLYGFPGEQETHYTSILSQLPALHHLAPPGGASRIALERFSPYFHRPDLGLPVLRPHWQYPLIYELPAAQLHDLAYLFESPTRGIDRQFGGQLDAALRQWQHAYPGSTLTHRTLPHRELGEVIELRNTRPGYDWHTQTLADPVAVRLFQELDQPRTRASLSGALRASGLLPAEQCGQQVDQLLAEWTALGLLFADGGRFIQLATTAGNQWLNRLSRRTPENGKTTPHRWWRRGPDRGGPDWLVVDVGSVEPPDAARAYRAGVRVVELPQPVDLAQPTATDVRALQFITTATAHGLHVSWRLRAGPTPTLIPQLSHLHPPDHLDQPGATDELERWWKGFFLGRCGWRQGPGFVQVRDRRRGGLAKYTITEPELMEIIYALDAGTQPVDLTAAAPLLQSGLVMTFGGLAWLAPYRLVRWPVPAMGV